MKIIIYDFEVFRYDTLLGAIILDSEKEKYFHTWDLKEIKRFYAFHEDDIWVGWNSSAYDTLILEAIVNDKNPYLKSKEIIGSKYRSKHRFKLYDYDLLNGFLNPPSLKLTEALIGKSIDTTEVDFDIDRPLTNEEKEKTEKYNLSDLNQTKYNFKKFYGKFELRLGMIQEFDIPLQSGLSMTGTQIAAAALRAKRDPSLVYKPIKAALPPTIKIKDQELIDWYLNEDFRKGVVLTKHICGTDITIASGGAHAAIKKCHKPKLLYADISGYYNLLMINFDLLPRTLSEEGKRQYDYMYHEQLKLKKKDPKKRKIYKTVCLSVFGAMNNEYTDFYDPWKALLVTSTGEMFLYDLLEKLDGLCILVNGNTDGVMLDPIDWKDEDKIKSIVQEWVERNGFSVKLGTVYNYHARDVNCYMMHEENGELTFKGDSLKNYDISDEAYSDGSFFNCKEPPIIAKALVECFMNDVMPEDFVEANKMDMQLFQYVCKKNTYTYLTYDETFIGGNKTSTKIQSPSRAFANNATDRIGIVNKHKSDKHGKHQIAKVANLPDNIFIWNNEIMSDEAKESISKRIDYQYYINRIYEKLGEFL